MIVPATGSLSSSTTGNLRGERGNHFRVRNPISIRSACDTGRCHPSPLEENCYGNLENLEGGTLKIPRPLLQRIWVCRKAETARQEYVSADPFTRSCGWRPWQRLILRAITQFVLQRFADFDSPGIRAEPFLQRTVVYSRACEPCQSGAMARRT